ncbi:MAG: ABC transporter substrate-binding protein [Rhizobiales bacterium]|nr:ABC transporter substrate-binding protein [Hyphomicrobiales bacterium]
MDRRSFIKKAGLVTVGGAAATALAAPAIAQSRKDMVIVSTWPRDFPGLGISAQRVAARIAELSEGTINVTYFAAGEKVGAFDVLDEVAAGNSQAYIGADYYWKGKHPAMAYFTAVPFGFTYAEMDAWMKFGGGKELHAEVMDQFGLTPLQVGNTGVQMGGWFNKEINSADDFKGLKMRIPGLGGDVLAKLGASVVALPGGQIYENLVSGAVDATEWVGPYNDYFLKFYEAAKYYYFPGMHEPGSQLTMAINNGFWGGLTKTQQNLITAACMEENAMQMAETNARNGEYLTKLINEHGVQLREFNDEVYDAMAEAAEEVFEETRAHSELAKKVHDAFAAFRSDVGRWMLAAEASYLRQRNRTTGVKL